MGVVFIFFVCGAFHFSCNPPLWATIGLFAVMYYQYSIARGLAYNMEELHHAE